MLKIISKKIFIDSNADLILFEPFTKKDNGLPDVKRSLDNIKTIIDDVTRANPNISFVIQPPPPMYKAVKYPKEVEDLKNFAQEQNIPYLDYWSEWPAQGTKEMKEVYKEDFNDSNQMGYNIWTNYVEKYFISK